MRILHVLHSFPPQGIGGTEHYVLHLASSQLSQGHDVAALYPLILPQGARCRLIRDRLNLVEWVPNTSRTSKKARSLQVYKVTNPNRNSLYWTAFNVDVEERIMEAVQDFSPDVVHIHQLYWLSVRTISQLKERFPRIKIVLTLHDYWYACYKGVLRKPDGQLCSGPKELKCMGCIEQSGLVPRAMRAVSRTAGSMLSSPLRFIFSRLPESRFERSGGDSPGKRQLANAWFFLNREREMLAALSSADSLIAPSKHLALWYEGWMARRGIEKNVETIPTVIHAPNALKKSSGKKSGKGSGKQFTFGFIGQLVPHKGAHHLLSAFRQMVVGLMAKGTAKKLPMLSLYGPAPIPGYLKELHALSAIPAPLIVDKISFEGRFEQRELSRVLSSLDVLVVPSRWAENSPIVIHEAVAAGIPVLAPRLGGMPELLGDSSGDDGVSRVAHGWLYGPKDALPSDVELSEALSQVMAVRRNKAKPAKLDAAAHAKHIERIYSQDS